MECADFFYILSPFLISFFSVCVIQGYPSLRLVILDGMYISAPLTMVFCTVLFIAILKSFVYFFHLLSEIFPVRLIEKGNISRFLFMFHWVYVLFRVATVKV